MLENYSNYEFSDICKTTQKLIGKTSDSESQTTVINEKYNSEMIGSQQLTIDQIKQEPHNTK
jgi:hypothetical protein